MLRAKLVETTRLDGGMRKIPVFKPLLEEEELAACVESLKLGWLGMGSYVGRFEDKFKEYIGGEDRFAVAVSTGHAALHLAFLLIGLKPGDEVITPSFNNIADFQAILATGAEPVFCDIDSATLCIDVDKLEELISPRTKAIVAMDYFCHICDHERVNALAAKHKIRIIHDAAHSLGSRYGGKIIGSASDIAIFSFDPVKTITTIDGGMVIVKTQEEMRALHEMRLIGMGQPSSVMYENRRAWTYDVKRLGFRYHMANLHGALGLSQLQKMPIISETRRTAARYYSEHLSKIDRITIPQTQFDDVVPFLYYIRVPDGKRSELADHLRNQNVDTGIHWQPGHWFSLFKGCRRGNLDVTEQIAEEILSLPFHSNMQREDQDAVISGIQSFFERMS